MKNAQRLSELDGIRGWAAFSVLLFHIVWEVFGIRFPEFRNSYTAFILNGPLAVYVFFVLSGEALSTPYRKSGSRSSIARLAVKRYLRLSIPIFFSCMIAYLLLRLGLVYAKAAAPIVNRPDWLGIFLKQTPDFDDLLTYSFRNVYVNHVVQTSYNPFLWTMSYEMLGSLMVLLWLYVESELRRPKATMTAIVIALLVFQSPLACFFIGLLYGQLRAEGLFARLQGTDWVQRGSWLGLLVCAALTVPAGRSVLALTACAAAILLLTYSNRRLSAFLAHNVLSRFLGRISFPLYLVHFSVIVSLSSWLIVVAEQRGALGHPAVWGIVLATVAASILAAVLFEPVERLTMAVCDRLARAVLKPRESASSAPAEAIVEERAAA